MKVKSLLSAFQKLKEQSKNGLLIHTLRNGLTRTGINLDPYVITVESLKFTSLPEIKDDASLYVVKQVDDDVIREIFEKMRWHTGELNTILALEHFSFVLYKQEQVAAFMIVIKPNYLSWSRIRLIWIACLPLTNLEAKIWLRICVISVTNY
jgi:hypothetical protein